MSIDADLRPGTVIVAATVDKGGWWIRLRSKILGAPALHNHVALFTHYDSTGRPRGLEGRPSGFGWANLDKYLQHPDTMTNAEQPMTDEQREIVIRAAGTAVGIPYDWKAIISFGLGTARLPFVGDEWPEDGMPSHVVCSSAVDLFYEAAGLANPGGWRKTRGTDPDDWTAFIKDRLWLS